MVDKTRANWAKWSDYVDAPLWQAIALSLDIEPEGLSGYQGGMFERFDRCPEEFKRRLDIASSRIAELEVTALAIDSPARSFIKLSSLREWAEKLKNPWTFPEDFPKQHPTMKEAVKSGSIAVEQKEVREDRRLKACVDAGLKMDKAALLRLPDGVGKVADKEGVSRQYFSDDVKTALKRKLEAMKAGGIT